MALALTLLIISAGSAHAEEDKGAAEVLVVAPEAQVFLHPERPELQLEAAWNGGLATPVKSVLQAPQSGKHWLAVVARDGAGNVSETRWIRVVVDDVPPEVEITTEPPAAADAAGVLWLPVGATAHVRAEDALSGIQGVLLETAGGGSAAGEFEAAIKLEEETTYELLGEALDGVDNRSDKVTLTVHTDATVPYGEFFVEGLHVEHDGRLVLGPEAELHVKIDDDRSGVVHWNAILDGEQIDKSQFHSGWSRGAHSAGAHTMDRVGNHVELGPFEFVYDDQGPEIALQVSNERGTDCDGGTVYAPPVDVSLAATDAEAGLDRFELSSDGGTWQAAPERIQIEAEELRLRATDSVGNHSEKSVRWTLDRNPPELALVAPDGTVYPASGDAQIAAMDGDVLQIQVEDDGCTVADVRYRYEDGRVVSRRGRTIVVDRQRCFIRPLQDRTCKLIVEATDQFGRHAWGVWHVRVPRPGRGDAE